MSSKQTNLLQGTLDLLIPQSEIETEQRKKIVLAMTHALRAAEEAR